MSKNLMPIWQPIITKSPFRFEKGDLLAPAIPENDRSIIFFVECVGNKGILHLKTRPIGIINYKTVQLAIDIEPNDLIKKGWYFVLELGQLFN